MFERYSEQARRVIFFARVLAGEMGGSAIEPEHLLLGIVKEDPGLGGWLESSSAREGLEAALRLRVRGSSGSAASGEVRLAAETKRVLELAEETANLGEIGPANLLAAIVTAGGGAATALREFGHEPARGARLPTKMVFLAGTATGQDGGGAESGELHKLVDLLPRSQMGRAKALLSALVAAGSGTT